MLIELPWYTDYKAQPFLVVLMTEHGSYSSVRGVGVQDVRLVSVLESEDDVTKEALIQLLEGSMFCGSTVPDFLSGEDCKRGSDSGEFCGELVIETGGP